MANEPEEPKQFHDVAHPGKTAADASSRPVIVSNRPMLKDPMLSGVDGPKLDDEQTVSIETETPEVQESHEPNKPNEPNGPHMPLQPSEATVEEQKQTNTELAPPVRTDQTYPSPKGSEASQNLEHIHNLVEDKTYFVHIGTPSRRRAFVLLLVPAILIGAAVAGYYAYSLFVK